MVAAELSSIQLDFSLLPLFSLASRNLKSPLHRVWGVTYFGHHSLRFLDYCRYIRTIQSQNSWRDHKNTIPTQSHKVWIGEIKPARQPPSSGTPKNSNNAISIASSANLNNEKQKEYVSLAWTGRNTIDFSFASVVTRYHYPRNRWISRYTISHKPTYINSSWVWNVDLSYLSAFTSQFRLHTVLRSRA